MGQFAEKLSKEIDREMNELSFVRDKLAVELHLMTLDMKTRWRALEKSWESVRNDAKMKGGTAARRALANLKAEYERLAADLNRIV